MMKVFLSTKIPIGTIRHNTAGMRMAGNTAAATVLRRLPPPRREKEAPAAPENGSVISQGR